MSGLKRFLFSAPVNDASGTQTFYIDAETAEAACERAEHRDTDGMYCDDSEVTDLGELELSSMEVTTVDDSGDFPPLSTAPQPSGQDERAAFECRVYRLAEEEKYSYMTSLLKRDPNTGDYSTSWVDMMWRGWQARSTLTAPSPAVVEPVALHDNEIDRYVDDFDNGGEKFIPHAVRELLRNFAHSFAAEFNVGKPAVVGGEAIAIVGDAYQLLWCGNNPKIGLRVGTKLYAPPIVEAETVRDKAAIAAIQYAISSGLEGIEFLRCWDEGNFDAIRKEWSDAPDAVFVGADPLYKAIAAASGEKS